MLHDPIEPLVLPPRSREAAPRHLMIAGVAAVALGVGAGLWARPAESERRVTTLQAVAPAVRPAPPRRLEIVVDESPAPLGAPIEVLPAFLPPSNFVPPPPLVEPLAPVRAPAGLVKVQSVSPAPEMEAAAEPSRPVTRTRAETRAPAKARPRAVADKPASPRVQAAKAGARAKPSEKAKAQKADVRKIRAEAPAIEKRKRAAPKAQRAKDRKARPDKAKLETAKLEKARVAKIEQTRLAKAEAAKAQAAKARKARLAKAKAKVIPAAAKPTVKVDPPPRPARGSGPLRKVRNEGPCASADPGAALVCSDPALGAADRQLTRAYRQAEAAGVPAWRLQQQQQRWLAARSAAAREAPWAVHDVYSARIAELRDQARDAGAF